MAFGTRFVETVPGGLAQSAIRHRAYTSRNEHKGCIMRADILKPGLVIDGVRIRSRVPFVQNRAKMIRVVMEDRTTRTFLASAEVTVGGPRQEWFPAGPVREKDHRSPQPNRKPRASDGRWEGESGGFHVTMVSRISAYDLTGRQLARSAQGPSGRRYSRR
ncbi:hypothetical protein [Micromonospora sp. NPDC047730]|uniref:hypothetical protein n=1 Tax=Micromonospora sp. NPDC047730 TaxID=3364253 RepID=UPI003717709C